MCHLFQFYRQREAERHHHLWRRWRLSSGWDTTVSVCHCFCDYREGRSHRVSPNRLELESHGQRLKPPRPSGHPNICIYKSIVTLHRKECSTANTTSITKALNLDLCWLICSSSASITSFTIKLTYIFYLFFIPGTRTSLRCPLTTPAENLNKPSDSTETPPLSWSTQQSESMSSFFCHLSTFLPSSRDCCCQLSGSKIQVSKNFITSHKDGKLSQVRAHKQHKNIKPWKTHIQLQWNTNNSLNCC